MSTVKDYLPDLMFAPSPNTVRGKSTVLNASPDGKNFLYTQGKNSIVRNLDNPSIADIITNHAKDVSAAAYSPSGYYIASGDITGKVKIWDTINKEHLMKYEYQPISGRVNDIAWTADNKRLAACGDGREKFGHVFLWDSGSSVGEIMGHSKSINSVAIRQTRPYRMVTASEDFTLVFFEGPPFKFKRTLNEHSNFVNAVRYSPDGEVFISAGSDKKAFVYDGKTGDTVGELGSPAHNGGLYGVSFSRDSRQALTCSGDKTCKIWDVETRQCVTTFKMGQQITDMQVGCLWQDNYLLSVSLSGHINYLDVNNPDTPLRVIKGTNKPIQAMAVTEDKSTVLTGSSDGHINIMLNNNFEDDEMKGKGHSNQVSSMAISGDIMATVGMDDVIIFSDITTKQYPSDFIKLDSQPQDVDSKSGITVAACTKHIEVFEDKQKKFVQAVDYEPKAVALNASGTVLAVSGYKDKTIHIYDLISGALTETNKITTSGETMGLEYSPDGRYLAIAGSDRRVGCYQVPDYKVHFDSMRHTAKVNCVAWSPDSTRFATGSLDTSFVIYDARNTSVHNNFTHYPVAHALGNITQIVWLNPTTILTCGSDSCIKKWTV